MFKYNLFYSGRNQTMVKEFVYLLCCYLLIKLLVLGVTDRCLIVIVAEIGHTSVVHEHIITFLMISTIMYLLLNYSNIHT